MIAIIEGEVRGVRELKNKSKELVKTKEGKQIYILRVEQKTEGATLAVDVATEKNSRKVGDKVSIKARVAYKLSNGKVYAQSWEL